jgi:hypothetical protein
MWEASTLYMASPPYSFTDLCKVNAPLLHRFFSSSIAWCLRQLVMSHSPLIHVEQQPILSCWHPSLLLIKKCIMHQFILVLIS